MRKSGLFCLLLTLLCSLRAFQLYLSATQELRASNKRSWLPASFNRKLNSEKHLNMKDRFDRNDSIVLDDGANNIFYFIQVTDLHLSRFRPKGHTYHFLHFIQSILPIVKPEFVAVTGDLTDAKDKKKITSQQYMDEWQVYQQAIKEKVNVDWYDMRGNHDCFDLPSWQSRVNYYRTHGNSAALIEQGRGVYSWQVNQPIGSYQFVAIDACPKRGPSRPLNFFGYLTSKTMDQLERALTWKTFNHTFVFSHYPTTTMVFGVSSSGRTFRDLASHYSIYMCGHLHKLLAGLGDVLKSYDPVTKSLELELGDLKEHGLYRIVAIDHDLISYVDLQLPIKQIPKKGPVNDQGLVFPLNTDTNEIIWPAQVHPAPSVLITNPKDARYSIPAKEPLWRIKQSTHIRFLVFAEQPVEELKVEIMIDSKPHLETARYVGSTKNPLWAAPWNSALYDDRKSHELKVKVTTSQGVVGTSTVLFRVDTHRVKIAGGSGEFIIKSKMSTVLQCLALFTIYSMLFLLIIPKCYTNIKDQSKLLLLRIHLIDNMPKKTAYARLQKHIFSWSLRFFRLPQDQPIVWNTTFLYILALLTLPWFRANFIPSGDSDAERYGILYMWGMVFANEWVPIADTWMFAAEQVIFDVFVFFILIVWRGTDSTEITCYGSMVAAASSTNSKTNSNSKGSSLVPSSSLFYSKRQWNEKAWFKGLEIVYWVWRSAEIIALASFYGGVWPTLIQNICFYWTLFCGTTLMFGKNGVVRLSNNKMKRSNRRYLNAVEGCSGCQQHHTSTEILALMSADEGVTDEKKSSSQNKSQTVLQYNSSHSVAATTLTQEEEQQSTAFMITSSGSSSCNSSTPFDGNPSVKSRKLRQLIMQ